MRKLMEGAGPGRPGVAGKVGELLETIRAGGWCEQQSSLMRAYAFGMLDPGGERHALAVAHCRECPACRAHVASLRGLAACCRCRCCRGWPAPAGAYRTAGARLGARHGEWPARGPRRSGRAAAAAGTRTCAWAGRLERGRGLAHGQARGHGDRRSSARAMRRSAAMLTRSPSDRSWRMPRPCAAPARAIRALASSVCRAARRAHAGHGRVGGQPPPDGGPSARGQDPRRARSRSRRRASSGPSGHPAPRPLGPRRRLPSPPAGEFGFE